MKCKPFIAICLLLAAGTATSRGENADSDVLLLKLKNQQTVQFKLESSPQIAFDDENLIISTASDPSLLKYGMADVAHIIFYNEASTDRIEAATSFSIQGDCLSVNGLPGGAAVDVYNLRGQLLLHATAGNDGAAMIDLSPLPADVYIISAPGITYKLARR